MFCCVCVLFFFFKQKTAYEMRISDWSSDVCSSDLFSEGGQQLILSVQLPLSVVIEALGAGARNFVALFFGCVVFALVFLRAVREGPASPAGGKRSTDARLALLRPAYFLGIFTDALSMSILPEVVQDTVAAAGLPSGWVSLPFTLFFVGLTVALLPASYVDRKSTRLNSSH